MASSSRGGGIRMQPHAERVVEPEVARSASLRLAKHGHGPIRVEVRLEQEDIARVQSIERGRTCQSHRVPSDRPAPTRPGPGCARGRGPRRGPPRATVSSPSHLSCASRGVSASNRPAPRSVPPVPAPPASGSRRRRGSAFPRRSRNLGRPRRIGGQPGRYRSGRP